MINTVLGKVNENEIVSELLIHRYDIGNFENITHSLKELFMILPRVKSEIKKSGTFVLPLKMRLSVCEEYRLRLSELVGIFFPGAKAECCSDAHITVSETSCGVEDYRIKIGEKGIEISCGAYEGLRNAMADRKSVV